MTLLEATLGVVVVKVLVVAKSSLFLTQINSQALCSFIMFLLQMSFLCMVHRKLCQLHWFLCTVHRKFLTIFGKILNFHLEPRTKILAHFKGSECEIAFSKFHFLPELIIENVSFFRQEGNGIGTVFCVPYTENSFVIKTL